MVIILSRTSMLDRGAMEITIMIIITGMENANGDGNEHEEVLCKYSSKFWLLSTTVRTCLVNKQINL